MKRSFLLWLIAIITLLTLTSCNHQTAEKVEEQPKQEQTTVADESENSKETKKTDKRKYILNESAIAQFPEVPDWQPEEMEEQIGRGYMIPQFLIDEYEKRGLDGKSMTICLPNGKQIAKLWRNRDGQYFFDGTFIDRGKAALFKNDNESITVLQESTKDRKLIGYSYYNDGNWNLQIIHMDYMDDAEAKLIDYADDFTIIYYPETSEAVCIRYGTEIGPRTKIEPNLLKLGAWSYESKDGAMSYNNSLTGYTYGNSNWLTIGFISEGRLIYPIILKNGEEVSFHLYVATVLGENIDEVWKIAIREAGQTEIDEIIYGVYQGNAYVIQNATKREFRNEYRGSRLIVEDTEIHLQVQEVKRTLDTQETETPPDVQETETLPEMQEEETTPEA